jgi:hypothetical protein
MVERIDMQGIYDQGLKPLLGDCRGLKPDWLRRIASISLRFLPSRGLSPATERGSERHVLVPHHHHPHRHRARAGESECHLH